MNFKQFPLHKPWTFLYDYKHEQIQLLLLQ